MSAEKHHPFHVVEPSPWPILTCFALLLAVVGGVMLLHTNPDSILNVGIGNFKIIFQQKTLANFLTFLGISILLLCLYSWWADVVKEGLEDNAHTEPVRHGLRLGMALFIITEVMFFFVFFWSFFKAWLFPVAILDGFWPSEAGVWPPKGIVTFDPWDLPFINTLILLLSGTTVTWAHYEIEQGNTTEAAKGIGYTVILGIFFTIMQAIEYSHAPFAFKDGIYASNFYLATGFHGLHVIIGTIFLAVCYFRCINGHFDKGRGHLGFEFAAWYWHFVDVVWLFLFVFVYVLAR